MVTFSHTDQGTGAAQWNAHGLKDLEQLDLSRVFTQGTKLVVLAAHPDDETLGAGGLIHQAVQCTCAAFGCPMATCLRTPPR
ncbi:hypothetical protein ACTXMY_06250 [Glutamicibacter ardleyensis]|uniref:hypothetical protein n=1 Tax=Glutamicibacter ardleyensis TaxID=225894 RepID=UPI003FD3A6FA